MSSARQIENMARRIVELERELERLRDGLRSLDVGVGLQAHEMRDRARALLAEDTE